MKQYLDLLSNIMENGCIKEDRTGTGTVSVFGTQMRFNLQDGFPLVTTKKVHWKSVVHELIWLISGNTNIKYLRDNNVKIWDKWADKNGDLGAVYGQQWRSWENNRFIPPHFENTYWVPGEYVKENIDQLKNVIERIKTNPECRRLIVSAWNVADLPKMALAPCHLLFQFNCRPIDSDSRYNMYIKKTKEFKTGTSKELEAICDNANIPKYFLDSHLYQRSSDTALGLPFNIASYSLLTHMIAQLTNTIPGEFVWTGGDTHCYLDHLEPLEDQLKREPYPLPQIKLNPDIKDIDDFKYEDIELLNYKHHPRIKMNVSV